MDIQEMHAKHREEMWPLQNWRSWGSWFSWGSPVGLGLFFIEIGAFLWLLHMAGLLK
jgi:hypothetical protein